MSTTDSTVDRAVDSVDEQQRREAQLIADVVASFEHCADPRLRELMIGIVEHVHAFIRETRLTEAEWSTACLLYTSPSPRDRQKSRMPSSA